MTKDKAEAIGVLVNAILRSANAYHPLKAETAELAGLDALGEVLRPSEVVRAAAEGAQGDAWFEDAADRQAAGPAFGAIQ